MDFEQLAKIENESERVNRTYDIFNEDARLNHSKAARVEFLTTVHYIEKYLKDGDKILDIGAGAGEYSLYFARKGYEVLALELADANIAAFKKKLTPEDKIDLVQGNALDLSRYADKSFDIVLLFGPLYHLKNDADKQKCISEAKRVCKDGGKIFFAFISNDFVFLTEFGYDVNYFSNGDYDKESSVYRARNRCGCIKSGWRRLRSESENLTVFSSAFTRTMLPVGWMMNALR